MAAAQLIKFAQASSIDPGATHHWWWRNAPEGRVWSFGIDPLPLALVPASITHRMEITRVEHRRTYHYNVWEQAIHVWIRNNGEHPGGYVLWMAGVGP